MCNHFFDKKINSDDDLYFLKFFSEYEQDSISIKYNFFYESYKVKEMKKICDFFNLSFLQGKDEITKVTKTKEILNKFLYENAKNKTKNNFDDTDFFDLVKEVKEKQIILNCRYISLIYVQMLLSLNMKSRLVFCLPMDLRYYECHCIVEVFLEEGCKWIAVDPSFNCLYFDEKQNILNLREIRKKLIAEEKIYFTAFDSTEYKLIKKFLIKNFFRFIFVKNNCYNMLAKDKIELIGLNPCNFNISNKKYIENGKTIFYSNFNNDNLFW